MRLLLSLILSLPSQILAPIVGDVHHSAASGITLISTTCAASANSNNVTTSAIDTTGANFIVVSIATTNGPATVVTDSKGNTWTPLSFTTGNNIAFAYVSVPTVGASHTFTATIGGGFPAVCVRAYSGMVTSSVLESSAANSAGSATSVSPGSVTPGSGNQLIVSALGFNTPSTSPTIGSGFGTVTSVAFAAGAAFGSAVADKIQVGSAAANPTWSVTGASNLASAIAVFQGQ